MRASVQLPTAVVLAFDLIRLLPPLGDGEAIDRLTVWWAADFIPFFHTGRRGWTASCEGESGRTTSESLSGHVPFTRNAKPLD